MKKLLFAFLSFVIIASACKKETTSAYNTDKKAPLSIEFDNIAGGSDLQLGTGTYTNASGEQLKVTLLKYFVSNFQLTQTDGTVYTVPQDSCYFLIDESNEATHQPILQLPEGEYSKLSFIVGVDSLRNTMDISKRTGTLDPSGAAAGMYWTWNSGYIFFKMEGTSPASKQTNNVFQYHIGLFGGYTSPTLNNIKTITLDLSTRGIAKVITGKTPNIHLTVDILKMFTGTTNVSIATNSVVMASAYSANIANNYSNMFAHDHTEN